MNYRVFEVVVECMTYNHSGYIVDTLNGFHNQKTKFPFLCIVMDDASTDGEQDVIKKYIKENCDWVSKHELNSQETDYAYITFTRHRINTNCFFLFFLLKENHYQKGIGYKKDLYIKDWLERTKYIALCEGDDYWTDSLKLQTQYDYMEEHLNCSLCHHDYKVLYKGKISERNITIPENQNLQEIAENNTVSTLTMFFRKPKEPLVATDFSFKYPVYQFFYNLRLAEYGYIHYINKPMSVYRVHSGGIYSCQTEKKQFLMSMGNIHNMISWYSKRKYNPEVVKILRKKAKDKAIGSFKMFLRKRQFAMAFSIGWWYLVNHKVFLGK